jgi:hypothetical protein
MRGVSKNKRYGLKDIFQHLPGDAEENQDSPQNRKSGVRDWNSVRFKWVVNIFGGAILRKFLEKSSVLMCGRREHEKRGKIVDEKNGD